MAKLFWIASGGALGALLRYGAVSLTHRIVQTGFPLGTLVVNVAGSLGIGVLWALAERTPLTDVAAAFLFIGVLGAFTTFSAFALESTNLLRNGQVMLGVLNIAASNLLCILAAIAGLWVGRGMSGLG